MEPRATEVTLHELEVPRTARYALLGAPSAAVREVWFALHGYGQLAREFAAEVAGLAGPDRLVVVPEGLSRYYRRGSDGSVGASWMTREAREAEVRDYVRYLDRLHGRLTADLGQVRVSVLGFSQGAATAFRWSVLGAVRCARCVLWAGGAAPDVDDAAARAALAESRLELVVGDEDPWISRERAETELARLEEAGLDPIAHRFHGGHRLDRELLGRLASGY